jgi:hypothetical protein
VFVWNSQRGGGHNNWLPKYDIHIKWGLLIDRLLIDTEARELQCRVFTFLRAKLLLKFGGLGFVRFS